MAHRISSALVVALCGGSLLACNDDEPTPVGETNQSITYSQLPLPLTIAPDAKHAYLFQRSLDDEGKGFGRGESEQSYQGVFGSAASWVANGSGWVVGLSGGASSYVQFPYGEGVFGTGDFTVMLDYAGTYTGAVADLVTDRDADTHGNFFNIRLCGPQPSGGCKNGQVRVEVDQDRNGTNYNVVQGGSINDGQWHRIAAVRRGKQLSLAIDGAVVATQQGPGIANLQAYNSDGYSYNPFRLGASMDAHAPTGTFNNLALYDRALSWAELAGIAAPAAFQDFTTAPTAWTNIVGTWTWDGAHSLTVASTTSGTVTWLPGLSVSDFAVETRLKINDAAGYAGLLLRGRNWSATNNGGQQYYVALFANGLVVGKNDDGWTEYGRVVAPVKVGSYNTLRVEAIGSTLDVYVDNVLTMSVKDGSYAEGGIGLKAFYGGATYDYVHVMPDLARGKATNQSSTDFGGVSSRAVDGNNDAAYSDGSITHTSIATGQWWQVDLGQISSVDHLTVWSRDASDCSDCGRRLADYDVRTSVDGVNWNDYPLPGMQPQRLIVPINGAVRYVQINQTTSATATPLSLAEVTAWGNACRADEIAVTGGACAPCPAGTVSTDGVNCGNALPLTPFGGGDYESRLIAVGSNLCMGAANTTTVHPRACDRHSDGWFLNEVADPSTGGKAYMIRTGSVPWERCLVADVPGADGTATVHATHEGCTGDGNLWNIQWNDAGQLQLHNEARDLCLAVARSGTVVEARTCTSETAELFNPDTLRPHTVTSPLKVKSSGLCLQLAADQSLQQQPCQAQPTAAQSLQLTNLDDGSLLIQGDGGNCLTVSQLAPRQGAQLVSMGCYLPTWQRWAAIPLDGGGVSLVSLYTGYCVSFPSTTAGVIPVQVPCTGTDDQRFDQTQVGGSVPMRVTLLPYYANKLTGETHDATLVIAGEAGAHVTTDARAIAVVAQESGFDLNDPTSLQQLLSLLSPTQRVQLTTAINGPNGLAGSVTFNFSPLNPIWSSASGTYNAGPYSGTFHLQPGSVGGTNTTNLGGGVSETIDWSLNYKGGVSINAWELDTPIGNGGFRLNDSMRTLLSSGQIGGSISLGSYTFNLTFGINGINYTGPGGQIYDSYISRYVNTMYNGYTMQVIGRGAVEAFTASLSWGEYAYGQAARAMPGFTMAFATALASGYVDVANAMTDVGSALATAVDSVESFFGQIGGWF
jgi:hypothetical protein